MTANYYNFQQAVSVFKSILSPFYYNYFSLPFRLCRWQFKYEINTMVCFTEEILWTAVAVSTFFVFIIVLLSYEIYILKKRDLFECMFFTIYFIIIFIIFIIFQHLILYSKMRLHFIIHGIKKYTNTYR